MSMSIVRDTSGKDVCGIPGGRTVRDGAHTWFVWRSALGWHCECPDEQCRHIDYVASAAAAVSDPAPPEGALI